MTNGVALRRLKKKNESKIFSGMLHPVKHHVILHNLEVMERRKKVLSRCISIYNMTIRNVRGHFIFTFVPGQVAEPPNDF